MSKTFRTSMILLSILLLLLGLVLILWPTTSQRVICYALGVVCLIAGISRVATQWKLSRDLGFQFSYLLGVLLALLGVLLLLKADVMIAIFGALVGLVLTADSIVKLQMSFQMRKLALPHWKAHAIAAAVLLVFGIVMLFDPFAGAKAMSIVMGAVLIVDAIANLWTVIELRGNVTDA